MIRVYVSIECCSRVRNHVGTSLFCTYTLVVQATQRRVQKICEYIHVCPFNSWVLRFIFVLFLHSIPRSIL